MSIKISQGMEKSAVLGKIVGRLPYGYKTEDNEIIVNIDESVLVKLVFKLYFDDGWGFSYIAKYLNQQEMLRRGKIWHKSTVKRMLENRTYYGVTKFKGNEYMGDFPAIIKKVRDRGGIDGRGGGFSREHTEEYSSTRQTKESVSVSRKTRKRVDKKPKG